MHDNKAPFNKPATESNRTNQSPIQALFIELNLGVEPSGIEWINPKNLFGSEEIDLKALYDAC